MLSLCVAAAYLDARLLHMYSSPRRPAHRLDVLAALANHPAGRRAQLEDEGLVGLVRYNHRLPSAGCVHGPRALVMSLAQPAPGVLGDAHRGLHAVVVEGVVAACRALGGAAHTHHQRILEGVVVALVHGK